MRKSRPCTPSRRVSSVCRLSNRLAICALPRGRRSQSGQTGRLVNKLLVPLRLASGPVCLRTCPASCWRLLVPRSLSVHRPGVRSRCSALVDFPLASRNYFLGDPLFRFTGGMPIALGVIGIPDSFIRFKVQGWPPRLQSSLPSFGVPDYIATSEILCIWRW